MAKLDVQCDGVRPTCRACQTRSVKCIYISKDSLETPGEALKRQYNFERNRLTAIEEFVNDLRYLPDDLAQDLLMKLRNTSDLDSILHIDNPSEKLAARGILPPMFSEQEFELHIRHPVAYPLFDKKDNKAFSERIRALTEQMKLGKNNDFKIP